MTETLSNQTSLLGGMAFQATTGSGHRLVMDAKQEVGGENRGPLPMEVFLQSLSACTAMDVISILRKSKQDVVAYDVTIDGDRAETHPKIFTTIRTIHTVRGRNLKPQSIHRAIELSETKYCSVGGMVHPAIEKIVSYRIIDEATGETTEGSLGAPAD